MSSSPIFAATSTSARQLYLLLRCIAFSPTAEVQITKAGIRFSVEESRSVQGLAFIEKNLFSSYSLGLSKDQENVRPFKISITALLETLQIFGSSENASSSRNQGGGFSSSYATAFNTPALALGGTCRISYATLGAPLSITIQEAGVTTTCEMNTYEIQADQVNDLGIPLDRRTLCLKVIMPSTWLHDAIGELSGTSPNVLVINVSETSSPYLALEGEGGPFGDSVVDFTPASKKESSAVSNSAKKQPQVTETFTVAAPQGSHGRIKQRYRFDLIKRAGRAMALASKVSIRQDLQGVLSLQFMIEVNEQGAGPSTNSGILDSSDSNSHGGSRVSFIDFRFVPLFDGNGSEEESENRGEESTESDE